MNPLLSIVIPTKDRYITLIPVLKGLNKDFGTSDVEFVIQDNTGNNKEIQQLLTELNSEKIKYFHTPYPLAVTENCDLAVKNSQGKYLIMIGDDDYVLPTIIEAVWWMEENGVECLNSNTANYYWPEVTFKYQTKVSNSESLIVTVPVEKVYRDIDPKTELTKVIKSGGTDFANLPRLYHGIVKRKILESIYDKCQTFFPGPSPDMANSSALAIFAKRFCLYNFPFSISGKSVLSTSGMGIKHEHVGNLDDKPFLDKKLLSQWDEKIPYFWSGDTIYAQSLSHCMKVCQNGVSINYNRLYAHLLVFERTSVFNKMEPLLNSIKSKPANFFLILYWCLIYSSNRIINYIKRKYYPQQLYLTFKNVNKIEDCPEILISMK